MAETVRQRAQRVLMQVADLPSAERHVAIDRACGEDAMLRAEVEAMLREEARAENPMTSATADVAPAGAAEGVGIRAREGPGMHIGPYKLLQLIGEGGFGSVFMAEQERPVVRKVALKIIKLGMDTKAVIARFEAERQALALMDHPNIARVLDAGATETGRPYFVMELCKGDSIVEYCDRNNLSIADRLGLFIQVCTAMQHAHTKGIIHRDIKPSNVLVSAQDGKAHAKVIDFGIAKATASKLTEKTLFTEHRQLIGTPEYMSPEQAEGSLDIDTRTDVYSLGVLLYELLTGTTPFTSKELRSAAYGEIQRIIREVDPPRPSTRLSQGAGTLATVAARRHTEPKRLGAIIRGDLDWIVMRAMEKDRQRRYETASALAMDVQRHLAGEAVIAAPPGTAYRVRKFVRRHKAPVIAAAAIAAALVMGIVGTSIGLRAAVRAAQRATMANTELLAEKEVSEKRRQAAELARDAARARADELKQVSEFQGTLLAQVDPAAAGLRLTNDVHRRFADAMDRAGVPDNQRLARAAAFRDQWGMVNPTDVARDLIDSTILTPATVAIEQQFASQAVVDAHLRQSVADAYESLGQYQRALDLQQVTLATRRRVLGDDHPDTLDSLGSMGLLLMRQGNLDEASACCREALERCRRVMGQDDPRTLRAVSDMSLVLRESGMLAEAEKACREALDGRRRVLGADHPDTITSANDMGVILHGQGRYLDAEPYYRETMERRRRVQGDDHPYTLIAISNVGLLLLDMGEAEKAEEYLAESLERSRAALGEDHPGTLTAIGNMAVLLSDTGRSAEAEPYLRELLDTHRGMHGRDHPSTLSAINNLSMVIQDLGKLEEAETLQREGVEIARRMYGSDNPSTITMISNLAAVLLEREKLAEAEAYFVEALEASRRVLGGDHPDTLTALNNFGAMLRVKGNYAEAERCFHEVVDKGRRLLGDDHPDTVVSVINLGGVLLEDGQAALAEPYLKEAMQRAPEALGEDHPNTLTATISMARLLLDQKRYQEIIDTIIPAEPSFRSASRDGRSRPLAAFLTVVSRARLGATDDPQRFGIAEADLLEAHAILVQARGESHKDTRECAEGLVELYAAWHAAEPGKGFDAKAVDWQRRVDASSQAPGKK